MDRLTKDEKKELRKQEWQSQLEKEDKAKRVKKIFFWIGIVLLLIGGFWALNSATTYPSPSSSQPVNIPPVTASDLATGDKNAKAVLIEYADFQCPGCGAVYPVVKKLVQDYHGRILFIYRFFPLESIHKNALEASEAAYAASLQGKFWEMHDTLFQNQASWAELDDPTNTFISYAKTLNLDVNKFKKDMSDTKTNNFIDDEENKGTEAGVNSTPTFFLNKRLVDVRSYDGFKQLIDQQLKGK